MAYLVLAGVLVFFSRLTDALFSDFSVEPLRFLLLLLLGEAFCPSSACVLLSAEAWLPWHDFSAEVEALPFEQHDFWLAAASLEQHDLPVVCAEAYIIPPVSINATISNFFMDMILIVQSYKSGAGITNGRSAISMPHLHDLYPGVGRLQRIQMFRL